MYLKNNGDFWHFCCYYFISAFLLPFLSFDCISFSFLLLAFISQVLFFIPFPFLFLFLSILSSFQTARSHNVTLNWQQMRDIFSFSLLFSFLFWTVCCFVMTLMWILNTEYAVCRIYTSVNYFVVAVGCWLLPNLYQSVQILHSVF